MSDLQDACTLPIALPEDTPLTPEERNDLEAYTVAVNDIIQANAGTEISNGSPLHARLILNRIFGLSKTDVLIYSGCLNRVVTTGEKHRRVWAHEPLIESACQFLRSENTKLSILVQNQIDGEPDCHGTDHPFLQRVFEDRERKGEIELVIAGLGNLNVLSANKHFAVGDNCLYRFETSNDDVWATASFNGPTLASILRTSFANLLKRLSGANKPVYRLTSKAPGPIAIPREFLSNCV